MNLFKKIAQFSQSLFAKNARFARVFFKTCEFKSSFPRGKKEQKDEKQEHSY